MASGLGTGISANAFMRHKISTTIVEIDPAIYEAARKWFGLADPGVGRVFLEDARSWVAAKHTGVKAGMDHVSYDIVVHDCFSGGGVPEHIFTVEFWDDLTTVMAPEAVLVVVSLFSGRIEMGLTAPKEYCWDNSFRVDSSCCQHIRREIWSMSCFSRQFRTHGG